MFKNIWWGLIQFGFRLLYNEMAWSYDLVSWLVSLGEWRKWQRAALPFLGNKGGRLLEIAHGPGHMLLELSRTEYEIHGCDLSKAMGRQASKRLREAKLPRNLTRCFVQAMPYASGSFSAILSTFPTNYIVNPDTLANLYRILRSGGRVVIVPEGHLTGRTSIHAIIAWLFRITGQQAIHNEEVARTWLGFTVPAERAGFRVMMHTVTLERSACTILILEKP